MVAHIQIGDISPRIQYSGDGVQTAFPYPFPVFADADIQAYVDGIPKILTSDYTVTGAGVSAGGSVTFVIPPAVGTVVTLRRNKLIARTSDFQESGEFRAKVINDELDILTALLQQVDERSARALHLSPTDAANQTELPDKAVRAGRYLGFDAAGAPTAIAGPLNTLPVSPYISTLLDDGDAVAARATLGAVIGTDVLAPTGDGSGLTGIAVGATDAEKANIALNAFRIAVNGGLSVQNMVDGIVDEFTDQTGVDTVASLNETYDAVNHFYHNPKAYGPDKLDGTVIYSTGEALSAGTVLTSLYDNNVATYIKFGAATTSATHYVSMQLAAGSVANKLRIMPGATSIGLWSSVQFQGSMDGITWTQIGATYTGTFADGVWVEIADPTQATTYVYYRAFITITSAVGYDIDIKEMELLGMLPPPNMTLQSNVHAALAQPANAFLVLWHEFVDAVTLNTDLKAWASRDGGTTWTQATLALAAGLSGNQQVLTGNADLSAQPAGTSMKWKIETLNAKEQRARGVSEQWS